MAGSVIGRGWAVLFVALTLGQAIPPTAAAPPESGTWYIDGDVVLQNGTFYINGDVQVNTSGSLTLFDCTLIFNASYVHIETNGNLVMRNARVILTGYPYNSGSVIIWGGSTDIGESSFINISLSVYSGDCRITSCNFSGPNAYISSFTHGATYSPIITNCTFIDTGELCIVSDGGDMAVMGCRFFRETSDLVDSEPDEGKLPSWQSVVLVRENQFNGPGIGINFSYYYTARTESAIYIRSTDQTGQLVQDNTFAGFDCGVFVFGYWISVDVNGNRFRDCTMAIDTQRSMDYMDVNIYGNSIDGCQNGIQVHFGPAIITDNTISNCTNAGFYGSYNSPVYMGPLIRDNTVTGCLFGAYLANVVCEFRSNNITDCPMAGIYSYLSDYHNYQCAILNNTVTNCGFYEKSTSMTPAAISVTAESYCRALVSGNQLLNNSAVGILADDNVQVDNNTIEGSRTGIDFNRFFGGFQDLTRNRISGGQTGIHISGVPRIKDNDISDVQTGILCDVTEISGASEVQSNVVHAREIGVCVQNTGGYTNHIAVTGNVIAAGIDGVLVDSVQAKVKGNDFGGTSGVCVHAIGQEPEMSNNSYGSLCSLQMLQEWYLTVRALQSPDPYNTTPGYFTDRYSVRIRNDTGVLSFSGESGGSTTLRQNLTGYTIDRAGIRMNYTRYSVIAMKPHIGVGRTPATLLENAVATIQLYPRADLAVQDVVLPAGRPIPGQTVQVEVVVVHDNTYDAIFSPLSSIFVDLRDNRGPVGEKLIQRLEPNSTATVRFTWTASGGLHELSAIVDPDQRILEAFEDNNVFSLMVPVNEPPVPVLSVSDLNPAAGRTVAFSSNGSTDDLSVARSFFDFGDGTDSGWTDDATVLHVYKAPGIFGARLMVADADGAASDWSLSEYITVTEGMLSASLTADSTIAETLVPVELTVSVDGSTGAGCTFGWNFGDGSSDFGTDARVQHVFARAGKYSVSASVSDPLGRRGAASVQLSVRNRPPAASFTFAPAEPTVLTLVQFRSVSGDPDGVVERWLWDLGDGNGSSGPGANHRFAEKGNYTVTLSVQDDLGARSAVAIRTIRIHNIPPVARASSSAANVPSGGSVRLDAGLTLDPDDRPSALTYRWDSPDGWSSTSKNVTRRFTAPGRFKITLTVTDSSGDSSQDAVTVEVFPAEETGGIDFRSLSTGLSIAAVLVFAVALYIFGKDRMASAPKMAPPIAKVDRPGGGKTKRPADAPPSSRANRKE